jgi:hypothetical protein
MLSAFDMDQLEAEGYRPLMSTTLPTRSGRAAPPRPAPPKHANDDLLDDILRGDEPLGLCEISLHALLQDGSDDELPLRPPRPSQTVITTLDDILLGLPGTPTVTAPLPLDIL